MVPLRNAGYFPFANVVLDIKDEYTPWSQDPECFVPCFAVELLVLGSPLHCPGIVRSKGSSESVTVSIPAG